MRTEQFVLCLFPRCVENGAPPGVGHENSKRTGVIQPMKLTEPAAILGCPDALDCAECDEAVECLSDILAALTPEQRRLILWQLRGDAP